MAQTEIGKRVAMTPRTHSWREWTFAVLEEGQIDSFAGRAIEVFLIALILANVAAVALETVAAINARFDSLFDAFEKVSIAIYTVEYLLRVWAAVEDPRIGALGPIRGRIAFVLRPLMIVDFLAFAPSYLGVMFTVDLRVLRVFRMFRLLKLARYSQALQALLGVFFAERSALFASMLLLLATMCVGGEVMYFAEGSVQPDKLGSIPAAMYWAITTLTTVGYGDITPETPLGKLVAGVVMVTGLGLFALPIGIIANGFVNGLSRRRFAISWRMLRELPLFEGLDMTVLDDVLEAATSIIVREHGQLTYGGAEARTFYLIVGGQALADDGETLREIGPGAMIGAEAMDHAGLYRDTVLARTDLRAIAISAEELRWLARKYPLVDERLAPLRTSGTARTGDGVDALKAENARLRRLVADLMLEREERKKSEPVS
ncbi:MAG TPA: cyclic nucleotide-gated ion channel [Rhizomicrobium sp.]|jgi:voltage-gated potassium channel